MKDCLDLINKTMEKVSIEKRNFKKINHYKDTFDNHPLLPTEFKINIDFFCDRKERNETYIKH